MNRRLTYRWFGLLLAPVVCLAVGVMSFPAGATTDPSTLYGEGGTFFQPPVTQLVNGATPNLGGLNAAYIGVGIDNGIKDFVGSAPKQFAADYAVSERPLTTAEAQQAKSDGRTFAYVPFAATPVAVGTLVPTSTWDGGEIDSTKLCPHINLTVDDLGALFGADTAQPVSGWNDPRFQCSIASDGLYTTPVTPAANDDPTMANYAVMSLMDSDPVAKSYFAAGLQTAFTQHVASTNSTTPSEHWPYANEHVVAGGDDPFIGKLLTIQAKTNSPSTAGNQWLIGGVFPISSIWTGSPLGAPWNIPTAAIQNAQGSFVAPSTASAAAAENDATLASNNLVTFEPSTADAAAYNSYMMEEEYFLVPLNGLSAAKAAAMAELIRYALGPKGQHLIESFGAAPATSAVVTAGLTVATELDVEAAQAASTSSSTTTTAPGSTTGTTGAGGSGASSDTGSGVASDTGSAGSGTSGTSGSNLAFTGAPDLGPLIGLGALFIVAGSIARRQLRRRRAAP
ncbi:MAG: hypothetical protein WB565_14145 [Acidimicrobiales bacterium]